MNALKKLYINPNLYNASGDAFISCYNLDSSGVFLLKENDSFKASGKTATVKRSKVKKKAQTISASKLYKVSPNAAVRADKIKGNKNFTVNERNGSITVKKGTKKGTYKITVDVMSIGDTTYQASGWRRVTVTIKVK